MKYSIIAIIILSIALVLAVRVAVIASNEATVSRATIVALENHILKREKEINELNKTIAKIRSGTPVDRHAAALDVLRNAAKNSAGSPKH